MTARRIPGKFNPNTTLIDIGMGGVAGITGVYLIQGQRSCLIDGGTRREAMRLMKELRKLDAFPPDMIIITHPHWDHTQGVPTLLREAKKIGKQIQVFASADAIPQLADASSNEIFGGGPYEVITGVSAIRDGESIDLGGITLRAIDVPGHCHGHLAILDETNGNIIVGDAIGDKLADDIFLPPFMPTTWNADAFLRSIHKLKRISYETLSLTHFGVISDSEAKEILNESVENYHRWWQWFDKHADRLDDTRYLLSAMRAELCPGIPEIKPLGTGMKIGLRLLISVAGLMGRRTRLLDRLYYGHVMHWLAVGYQMSKAG